MASPESIAFGLPELINGDGDRALMHGKYRCGRWHENSVSRSIADCMVPMMNRRNKDDTFGRKKDLVIFR
jgi:hypothetical protein